MFRFGRLVLVGVSLVLVGCSVLPTGASVAPTPAEVTPRPTATPTAVPTPRSTPTVSATPVPTPSPTPDPAALDLEVWSCQGGVVLHWSASVDPAFHHYTALRSPEDEIAPHYPPIAPAVDWGDTYATDRFVTSAVDASIIPSETTWFYRVMAYDVDGAVIGSSPVVGGQLKDVVDLGPTTVEPADDGRIAIRWAPFRGSSLCFSHYRVQYGTFGGTPTTVLAVVSGRETTELLTDALHAGTTYQVRVQAIRTTTLGSFVAGETEIASYVTP
jgi:hypothetical protein